MTIDAISVLRDQSTLTYLALSFLLLVVISLALKLIDISRDKRKFKSVYDVGVPATENLKSQLESVQVQNADFDFVIVGGGTAGCVLASRLSEDPSVSVLLLEAGQSGEAQLESRMPGGFSMLYWSKHDYHLYTSEQTHAGGRRRYWPRGKLLGGCSATNATMFHRGAPSDFDEWAREASGMAGAEEWSFANFERYLLQFEDYQPHEMYPGVDAAIRGRGGPVKTGYPSFLSNFSKKWIAACSEIGLVESPDVNTARGSVFPAYPYLHTHFPYNLSLNGKPDKPNLTVVTGAHATKILFSTGKGKPKAIGVEFSNGPGQLRRCVRANREVILSAGTVHSPHLLLLSGVGPAKQLADQNVATVHDLPGVGQHLKDHPAVNAIFEVAKGESFMPCTRMSPSGLLSVMPKLVEWLRFGTGLMSSSGIEAAAFVRSDDPVLFPNTTFPDALEDTTSGSNAPDLEMLSSPFGWWQHKFFHPAVPKTDLTSVVAILLRPTSKGTVTLRSSDPFEQPNVDPNYLSTDHDVTVLARGLHLALRTTKTKALKALLAPSLTPSSDPDTLTPDNLHPLSMDSLKKTVKNRMETLYHPTSSCRMAPLEKGGVVDAKLRVHGVESLRIVDCSIFPNIISGHTAAAAFAVAEKASDMIEAQYGTLVS